MPDTFTWTPPEADWPCPRCDAPTREDHIDGQTRYTCMGLCRWWYAENAPGAGPRPDWLEARMYDDEYTDG
jgi:hypothetical protein